MVKSLFSEGSCSKFTLEFLSEVESEAWREGGKEGQKGKGTRKEGSGWQERAWPAPVYRSEDVFRLVLSGDGTGGKKPAVARKTRLSHPKTTTVSETYREGDRPTQGYVPDPSEGASVYESGSPNTTLEVLPNQGQSVETRSRASPRFIHP